MALKPEVLASKGSYVDDPEHVGLAWLNRYAKVLGVVHESRVGHRLGSSRIGNAHELLDQRRHLVVVPIRKCKYELLVILILVRVVRVMNDQWATETIGILASDMRVIPVCARLVDLQREFISFYARPLTKWSIQ